MFTIHTTLIFIQNFNKRGISDEMQILILNFFSQMCTEDIPRQERALESYTKQALLLDAKVMSIWSKWDNSRQELNNIINQALTECPDLQDFVDKLQMQRELRYTQASNELRHKLLLIENEEINAFTEYMSDLPNMLKKLYLTLKGYDRVTPALTQEYLDIMKKAKSAKGISWSDEKFDMDSDFKHICNLDLEGPIMPQYGAFKCDATIDIATDSEDLTDVENRDPIRTSGIKRKGTPIKLLNNETIIINDTLENLDTTKTMSSSKKIKREIDTSYNVENCALIRPKDLNSTFDMAGNMEALKRSFKAGVKAASQPEKKELSDKTNTMTRSINFNEKSKSLFIRYNEFAIRRVVSKYS